MLSNKKNGLSISTKMVYVSQKELFSNKSNKGIMKWTLKFIKLFIFFVVFFVGWFIANIFKSWRDDYRIDLTTTNDISTAHAESCTWNVVGTVTSTGAGLGPGVGCVACCTI